MTSSYVPTIGLEVHAELKTASKMFCSSKNDANEQNANVNVCPVCMSHPGTLPVVNREAVWQVLRVGTALKAKLADYTEFDRKNYFYPDLPKGYQISQYEYPLVSGGELNGVAITRVHLEEDTASSIHDEHTGETTIDYNRAGVPLMELVTEPVIHSAEQAGAFGRELQLLLRTLGASDADMEKGQMRLEANISVSKDENLGTKVEVKNINSFRAMERAVAYEISRQSRLLEKGEKVTQETRGWDENTQSTFPQRIKEGSADYRYFPDPDIPSFRLSEIEEYSPEMIKKSMVELPWEKRNRYLGLGITSEDAELYVQDKRYGLFYESVVALLNNDDMQSNFAKVASNYISNDLVKIIRDIEERETNLLTEIPVSPVHFVNLLRLVANSKISTRSAKDLLLFMITDDRNPEIIANEKGLFQTNDENLLQTTISEVISVNSSVVADFRAGKSAALEFLVGQCMKKLRGAANAANLREMITKMINLG